jgi:membrane protein YdbS with pleckstrin-like domain
MLEKYKMDNKKIKEIRIWSDLVVVLYILVFLVISIIEISFGLNPSINEMLNLIILIISLMLIMAFIRDITLYKMWEDIIEAIEEIKNNKSKNG